jgi:hydroxymethylpyrimidine pyrophosphatase-like HAD family hydrolase
LLGIERVICFGDNDNDLSMFEVADESYAPANATDAIKSAATAVIGHHDEEGIAHFLRERFELE